MNLTNQNYIDILQPLTAQMPAEILEVHNLYLQISKDYTILISEMPELLTTDPGTIKEIQSTLDLQIEKMQGWINSIAPVKQLETGVETIAKLFIEQRTTLANIRNIDIFAKAKQFNLRIWDCRNILRKLIKDGEVPANWKHNKPILGGRPKGSLNKLKS